MDYTRYHEQTEDAYRHIDYGGNSIYNSGCGPASLANALMVLDVADITVADACKFAVSCGARIKGAGTDMHTLLSAATKKWKITYGVTSSNSRLATHLRAGGVAIVNQGSSYEVFSNGGHFVVAASIDNNDNVTIIDSYWNSNKYRTWPKYHAKSKVLSRCFVRTPLEWCGKATIDRFPSYYLIARVDKKTENKKQPTTAVKEAKYIVKNLEVRVNGSTQHIDAINHEGHNYVRLDQLPRLLPVMVDYDGVPIMDTATINVAIDGDTVRMPGGIIAPGKSLAYITDLAHALGYDAQWDSVNKSVVLTKRINT